ncbi:MAG: hypothetical protein ABR499_02485 [Gemmatimonadaceae bacterium]
MTYRAARLAGWLCVATGLALLAPVAAGTQSGGAQGARVSYGVKASADTVRIGDPFTVSIRVRTAPGATIEFPAGPDSTSAVQLIDPRTVRTAADTAALDQTATYRLAAWDIGPQPIVLGDVVVREDDAERRIPVGRASVFVRSVLPADSSLRVPKPARPLIDQGVPRWWVWALIAAAVALGALLLWWWLRRRRRNVVLPVEDPLARAEREFARVEALRLIEAGERGRHVALMVDVLRDYLAARYTIAPLSLTSSELTRALHREPAAPLERLSRLLDEADLIKFARRPVTRERAMELGREARAIVRSIHASLAEQATAVREQPGAAA